MKTYIPFSVLMIAAASTLCSQTISFGVNGGVPLLDTTLKSRPYIVGPSIEIRLPAGFAIEADALYRRVRLLAPGGIAVQGPYISSFSGRQRGNCWEFPILGKYYFRPRASGWQPFLGSGFALRTVGFHSDATQTIVDASGVPATASHALGRRRQSSS